MSPALAFILALLCTPSWLKADMNIDKDVVRRMREREEFLHQKMTQLLQEVDDNKSIMESLFLSARQLLWLPWLTNAGQKVNPETEKSEAEWMQEREESLLQERIRLLQEMDGNNSVMESWFLSAQQLLWLSLLTEAVLLSLAFWLVRRWNRGSASCRTQEGSSSKWNIVRGKFSSKEKVSEHEKDKGADWGGSILAVPSPSPMGTSRIRLEWAVSNLISLGMSLLIAVGLHWMVHKGHPQAQLFCDSVILQQGLPSTKVLQELVDELLSVCRVLSRRNFMPELHPAVGMDTSPAVCGIQENSSTYHTLVILRPPPGHSFSLESRKWPPARRIRVALECLCSGEQLLGHTCFLHASDGQLPTDQEWYLMDTLCTGSYLDAKKVTRWVQTLVLSAWLLLPQSRHSQLTALPCGKSCSFLLSGTSGLYCSIEMTLAVQQGCSSACLSLE